MSNTERQRQFRKRNPGYYQRLHASRRAAIEASSAARRAAAAVSATREPLLLPAPVVLPVLPGINTIAKTPTPELVPVSQTVSHPAERSIAA